jgi:hypothetical protein
MLDRLRRGAARLDPVPVRAHRPLAHRSDVRDHGEQRAHDEPGRAEQCDERGRHVGRDGEEREQRERRADQHDAAEHRAHHRYRSTFAPWSASGVNPASNFECWKFSRRVRDWLSSSRCLRQAIVKNPR